VNTKDIKEQAKKAYKFDLKRNVGVEFISLAVKFAAIFTLITVYIICLTKLGSPAATIPAALILLTLYAVIYLFVIAPVNLGRNLYFSKVASGLQPATDEMFHFYRRLPSAIYAYFRIAIAMVFYTVFFVALTIVYFRIYFLFSTNWFTPVNFILCAVIVVIYALCIIVTRLKYAPLPVVYHKHSPMTSIVFVAKTLRFSQGIKMGLFKLYLSFAGWYILGVLSFGIGFIWIMPYIRIASGIYLSEAID